MPWATHGAAELHHKPHVAQRVLRVVQGAAGHPQELHHLGDGIPVLVAISLTFCKKSAGDTKPFFFMSPRQMTVIAQLKCDLGGGTCFDPKF